MIDLEMMHEIGELCHVGRLKQDLLPVQIQSIIDGVMDQW